MRESEQTVDGNKRNESEIDRAVRRRVRIGNCWLEVERTSDLETRTFRSTNEDIVREVARFLDRLLAKYGVPDEDFDRGVPKINSRAARGVSVGFSRRVRSRGPIKSDEGATRLR